jgi:CHAT domain-containing protein
MRSLTEQLYLNSGDDPRTNSVEAVSLQHVQDTLRPGTILIEFYNDGSHFWAFILDGKRVHVHPLAMTAEALGQLQLQLKRNITSALSMVPQDPSAQSLTLLARRILNRLYSHLIEPLQLDQYQATKLIIVPYGGLHYLPFHILYDGSAYLMENYELVILPAAGLATRPTPRRAPGALVLADSWGGRLPHTLVEARMVQQMFGGVLYTGEAANRAALQAAPTQILHIAAHGEHRLDQPDLSYLHLADGQLYADDTLQQDMSYELVTLSACETGRANVAAGDELIGLGRGFLYAGAGSLLASLWQVADTSTLVFMECMYAALRNGASKSQALRGAQQHILSENPQLHPAFWGAFQLIGNDSPLSTGE